MFLIPFCFYIFSSTGTRYERKLLSIRPLWIV